MENSLCKAALAACLFALPVAVAQADGYSLVVSLDDGTAVTCGFAQKPQMDFAADKLTLTTQEGTLGSWEFTAVDSWHFAEGDPSGIAQAQAGSAVAFNDGHIYIMGEAKASLYDLAGKAVNVQRTAAQGGETLSTRGLAAGVYVLKVGKQSMKFTVNK